MSERSTSELRPAPHIQVSQFAIYIWYIVHYYKFPVTQQSNLRILSVKGSGGG